MENFVCTYCQNPILTCRIVCVQCKDIELCLQCFACGIETGLHKKDHDYRVAEDAKFTVFPGPDAWSAEEEESFLESVEQYGLGNWEDVAKLMKTRSAEECREHYFKYYVNGNIGKYTFPTDAPSKIVDHTCPDGGPLSPSITAPLPPLELSLLEQHELGYMPLRDDFEREYDNDAETLVSSLSLNYDDEEIDTAYKLAQVDMYRQRWKNRQRCKQIAREYTLVKTACTTLGIGATNGVSTPKKSSSQSSKKQKKQSKDEKDLYEKLKPMGRFHTSAEHDKIITDFLKEKKLKARIKELMKYRKNGITKLEESSKYESQSREKKGESTKKQLASRCLSSGKARIAAMATRKPPPLPPLPQPPQPPPPPPMPMSMELRANGEGGGEGITIAGDIKPPSLGARELATLQNNALLTARERKLCRSIGLKPANYITIKTCIIKDYLQRRQGTNVKIRYPSHLDKTHRRQILSFLSDNGWISTISSNA